MRGVARQEQVATAEPARQPVLEGNTGRPAHLPDRYAQARCINELLYLPCRDFVARLPEWTSGIQTSRACGEHTPRGTLPKCEEERQPVASDRDVEESRIQRSVQFHVGQDGLYRVWGTAPLRTHQPPHRTGLPVASGEKTALVDPRASPGRNQVGIKCALVAGPWRQSTEINAPLHLHTPRLEGPPEYKFDVGLPQQGQMREGRVRQICMTQAGFNYPCTQVDAGFRRGVCPVQKLARDSQGPETLQRAGMEHHGARRAEGFGAPVHNSDSRAVGVCL